MYIPKKLLTFFISISIFFFSGRSKNARPCSTTSASKPGSMAVLEIYKKPTSSSAWRSAARNAGLDSGRRACDRSSVGISMKDMGKGLFCQDDSWLAGTGGLGGGGRGARGEGEGVSSFGSGSAAGGGLSVWSGGWRTSRRRLRETQHPTTRLDEYTFRSHHLAVLTHHGSILSRYRDAHQRKHRYVSIHQAWKKHTVK